MKIVFISNYLNHHQIPFCKAMMNLCEDGFFFISMEPMADERKAMGWEVQHVYDFEIKNYLCDENKAMADKLIRECDVAIFGGGTYAPFLHQRITSNKLTFLYSERVYRKGLYRLLSPRGQFYMRRDNTRYADKALYLLAAGAYTPFDYSLVGAYRGKAFKWGYFPQTRHYEIDLLMDKKNPAEILWVSRMIPLKHPELILELAQELRQNHYKFHITMVGKGQLYDPVLAEIRRQKLEKYITVIEGMSPEQVRGYMEKASVFLFTSDKQEGWGAVLNESMNSGCAVVASHAIGAVPYLIRHRTNGLVYEDGNAKEFFAFVKELLDQPDEAQRLGKNAYDTIVKEWNAEIAARRLIDLSDALINKKVFSKPSGPCSKADIIYPCNMLGRIRKGKI